VTATNLIAVDVELPGSLPTTRCIRFVTDDCGQTVDVELAFTDHDLDPGTPVRAAAIVEVDCGTWTSLCAKDEQHTQWDTTSLSLSGDGSMYVADAVLTLTPGDTDDDGDVDINDVTWLVFTFGSLAADGGCAWDGTRDADFNNGGAVGSEDYSLLSDAWQTSTSCACAAPAPAAASAIGTDRLAPEVAARVDLDGSGVFDATDVRLFEIINALPRTLSERMGWTAQQAGKGSNP
ncbi:MAG: hypothetical protein KDA25_01025, partial [Phycisphaerales bacterium]|nr:hypothetical protein [Phycisphaerales bacterium]